MLKHDWESSDPTSGTRIPRDCAIEQMIDFSLLAHVHQAVEENSCKCYSFSDKGKTVVFSLGLVISFFSSDSATSPRATSLQFS